MSEFEITGPGEYRTREGRKETLQPSFLNKAKPWRGKSGRYFADSGRYFSERITEYDIIGPWAEPDAPLTITITEVTSYRATDGTHTGMGQTRAEAAAALFKARGEG